MLVDKKCNNCANTDFEVASYQRMDIAQKRFGAEIVTEVVQYYRYLAGTIIYKKKLEEALTDIHNFWYNTF